MYSRSSATVCDTIGRYKSHEAAFLGCCLKQLHHDDGSQATAIRYQNTTELYLETMCRELHCIIGKEASDANDQFIYVYSTFVFAA
jgi:hypothetical protein